MDTEVDDNIDEDYTVDDILLKQVSIKEDGSNLDINLNIHKYVRNFEAFLTVKPERFVIKLLHPPFSIKNREVLEEKIKRVRDYEILLVDDDDGVNNGNKLAGVDIDDFYIQALDKFGIPYTLERVKHNRTGPGSGILKSYDIVIWITGIDSEPVLLSSTDIANINAFLENGGKLILVSQNFLSDSPSTGGFRELLSKFGIKDYYKDTKVKTVECVEDTKVGISDIYYLDTILSKAGNWGDGMDIKDGYCMLLTAEDGYCYGVLGYEEMGYSAILYSVEVANIVDSLTLGHFMLDSLNYLISPL
jgi:hypothetical protein